MARDALGRGTVPMHVMDLVRGTMSRDALGPGTVARHDTRSRHCGYACTTLRSRAYACSRLRCHT